MARNKKQKVEIELDSPIDLDSDGNVICDDDDEGLVAKTITRLFFRKMKVKDTLIAEDESNEARAGFALFAHLAGVSVAVIEELDLDDLEKINQRAADFMGKSAAAAMEQAKATGSSPSAGES